jgi:hypothetical protein
VDKPVEQHSRLETRPLKVRDIIQQYGQMQISVPEFQRDYVWKPSRAPLLMDSLYRNFPISSLLVWISDAQVRSRRPQLRPLLGKTVSWLIDGQQRVITLMRVFNGDDGIDLVFSPTEEKFRLTTATTRRSPNWFRVSEVFNDKSYLGIRRRLLENPRLQAWEAKLERLRRILDYEIPAVMMFDHSFDEAVEAFERINTKGVKLKREEIVSAHVSAKHSGFIAEEVVPFVSRLHERGFSRLDARHLFRACGFIAAPDGRIRTPLSELTSTQVTQAWSRTKKAVDTTIGLVREEFGLTNMDILWSGTLLVPVIVLCASTSKSAHDHQAIAGWLTLAALTHRYFKGTDSLDQDLRACRADDPIGKLLANIRRDGRGLQATAEDFKGRSSDKGALFGLYAACRHMGLCDIFTGTRISLPGRIEPHYLLPRAQFSPSRKAGVDTLANVAFVDGATTRTDGPTSPDVYLGRLNQTALASQCIPSEQDHWRPEQADQFWEDRRVLVASALTDFLRTKLSPKRMSCTP